MEEAKLIKIISKFESVVAKAGEARQPYLVANYLLDLAAVFNGFYHKCKVINSNDLSLSRARLALIAKVAEILSRGLELLSIETVEEM